MEEVIRVVVGVSHGIVDEVEVELVDELVG